MIEKTLSVLLAGAIATSASADIRTYNFVLDGLQEVPSVTTPGFGSATVMLDDVTGDVTITGSFSDLIGTTQAAHLHGLADVGANAGVIFGLTIDLGVTSGSFSGMGTLTAAQIQGMIDGRTYINVHTSRHGGGEIRGQVVPAPATLGAMGLGLLVAGRRRR